MSNQLRFRPREKHNGVEHLREHMWEKEVKVSSTVQNAPNMGWA